MKKVKRAFAHQTMTKLFGSWRTMMLLFSKDFHVKFLSLARGEKGRKAKASAEEPAFNPLEKHNQAARPTWPTRAPPKGKQP